MPAERVI